MDFELRRGVDLRFHGKSIILIDFDDPVIFHIPSSISKQARVVPGFVRRLEARTVGQTAGRCGPPLSKPMESMSAQRVERPAVG